MAYAMTRHAVLGETMSDSTLIESVLWAQALDSMIPTEVTVSLFAGGAQGTPALRPPVRTAHEAVELRDGMTPSAVAARACSTAAGHQRQQHHTGAPDGYRRKQQRRSMPS
jgi:hypothetical protein